MENQDDDDIFPRIYLSYLFTLIHILRLDDALDSYNQIRQSLAETQVIFLQTLENQCSSTMSKAKAETLCVCWNKLDQDVSELTKAITSGGASKVNLLL